MLVHRLAVAHHGSRVSRVVEVADVADPVAIGELFAKDGNDREHAVEVVRNDGEERRRGSKPAVVLHLLEMLVLLSQRIQTRGFEQYVAIVGFILRDHLVSAAAVSGERGAAHERVFFQDTACDQGRGQREKPACVAAGHAHARRAVELIKPAIPSFRQAIDPAFADAVRGGRVDDAHMLFCDHLAGFDCRILRQAENRHIAAVEHFPSQFGIFAFPFRQGEQLQIRALGQPIIDPQSRGSFFAVDKNFRHRILVS